MHLRTDRIPTTYASASALLADNDEVTIAYETKLSRTGPNSIALVHFKTCIVFYHPDDTLALYTGGYNTKSTKERINAALGNRGRVWTHKGEWCYYPGQTTEYNGNRVPFEEGMVVF